MFLSYFTVQTRRALRFFGSHIYPCFWLHECGSKINVSQVWLIPGAEPTPAIQTSLSQVETSL